ncbi:MAG: ComF family protein [Alphaproteobacteria bacterium]|nr:ComF family protein [Alphaproteobacteria bacterium]
MGIWQVILNSFLPPRCQKCGKILKEDIGLCKHCLNQLNFITQPYCQKCGQPFEFLEDNDGKMLCGRCLKNKKTHFRLSRSAFVYNEDSKSLILNFKFNDRTENANYLAKILFVAGEDIFNAGVDIMVPVPLHYTRLIKRRYNQSALLCNELSKISGIECDNLSLIRHHKTRPQVELSGIARQKNVHNVFSVKNPIAIKGKRVLLVDDVLTTGATLRECAKTLKSAGAKSVDTLTLGRVI